MTYECQIPFLGFCSVLVDAETPEDAMTKCLKMTDAQLLNPTGLDVGGVEKIHFKTSVQSGPIRYTVNAKEKVPV
jgi:hypothetical protein